MSSPGAPMSLGLVLAAPAAAHISVQQVAADAYTLSAGRLGASSAALLGLVGVVIGGLALARPAGRFGTDPHSGSGAGSGAGSGSGSGAGPRSGRLGATVALAAGLLAMALGGLVAATADGGLGTGNGLGGAFVALLVGVIAVILGALALTRSRRTAARPR